MTVVIESFAPVENRDCQVLILGSMPGRVSLEKRQYYAHSRNSFWYIMGELFGFAAIRPYKERLEILLGNKVALWDVIGSCSRSGSLDSNIDDSSLKVNDLKSFISNHPSIRAIFFNGSKAEQAYLRYIAPVMEEEGIKKLYCQRLPSTSPAHAGMSPDQKLAEWRIIEKYLV